MKQFEIKPHYQYGVIASIENGSISVTQDQDAGGEQNIILSPDEARLLASYLLRAADEMDSELMEQQTKSITTQTLEGGCDGNSGT